MKHYLYAVGAILCWASLPAATGSGLAGLTSEELMFFSFTSAAIYLYLQDVLLTRSFAVFIPDLKATLLGVWGIFLYPWGKNLVPGNFRDGHYSRCGNWR